MLDDFREKPLETLAGIVDRRRQMDPSYHPPRAVGVLSWFFLHPRRRAVLGKLIVSAFRPGPTSGKQTSDAPWPQFLSAFIRVHSWLEVFPGTSRAASIPDLSERPFIPEILQTPDGNKQRGIRVWNCEGQSQPNLHEVNTCRN
jgi:hypothetical protein